MESQFIQVRRAAAKRLGRRAAVTAAGIAVVISGVEWYQGRDWAHVAAPVLGVVLCAPLLYLASIAAERATRSWWGAAK